MPFPDLPPQRIPGSPGHLNDHQLIDQALDYVKQGAYKNDPNFPPLPDLPVLGQSGHVTAHDRILAILEYVKTNPVGETWAVISNNPTGTYQANDGHTYAYYRFTSSGTLTVTGEGLVNVCVVGGGGGGSSAKAPGYFQGTGGDGGQVVQGVVVLTAKAHNVTVGGGGAGGPTSIAYGRHGGTSAIAGIRAGGGPAQCGYVINGQNGTGASGSGRTGITDYLTGKAVTYGVGGRGKYNASAGAANTGNGGNGPPWTATQAGGAGGSGVVIIRTRLN